jgi:hypothetical protein
MTIGRIGSRSSASALNEIKALVGSATSNAGTTTASSAGSDTSTTSGPAAMLSKLKELQASDPAKFKQVMADISAKLKDASQASTDPREQKMLSEVSAKFAKAGATGDLSVLAPPRHGGGGHGKPPAGGAPPGGASSSSKTSAGPADTNSDGKVSAAEQQAYDAKVAAAGSARSAYESGATADGHAKAQAMMSAITSIVDSAIGAAG